MKHNNNLLSNNSIVSFEDITGGNHLFCLTNTTECCKKSQTPGDRPAGFWFRPNDTRVPNHGNPFNVDRGRGFAALNYSGLGTGLSGLYHCVIPDSNGMNVTLVAGIYPNGQGTIF